MNESTMGTTHSPHAAAVRMSGFFCQTLNERGITTDIDDLRWALPRLAAHQFEKINHAIQSMAKGHDQQAYMDLAALLRRLSQPALRADFSAAGIAMRLDVLFEMAMGDTTREALFKALAGLASMEQAQRQAATAKLRTWCGSVQDDEVLPLPCDAAPTAQVQHRPDASVPGPVSVQREPYARARRADAPAAAEVSATVEDVRPAPAGAGAIRRKAKVFGKSGALTLETAPVRSSDQAVSTARCTVMVEGAQSNGAGGFDWSDGSKVVFMCTQRELPELLAVLMGWTSELEFKFHGVNRQKTLHVVHQDHGLLVHLREATRNIRVPVADSDRYALAMLVLAAMAHNEPHLDSNAIMAVARAMAVAPAWRRGLGNGT